MQILALNVAGQPFRWLDAEQAVSYHAVAKVAWSVGDPVVLFRGGTQKDGQRSLIASAPIIALSGSEVMARVLRESIPLGDRNDLLFRRDRHLCAYCGGQFGRHDLTRDHVLARSRGGRDDWGNVVSACRACNERKAARTPEEARMGLLYVPYAPCRNEHFILSGRNILADQMEYLAAKLPKHSRWLS
jgi:hypothetical protein